MAAIVDRPGPSRTLSLNAAIARIRLVSGLILFAYVLTHLLNHAVGIWSLEALAAASGPFVALWRNPVGTVLLYGGLAAHVLIALRAIWLRDSLRAMSPAEIAQLVLGLAIPLLLLDHAIATRYASAVLGVNDSYTYALLNMWVFSSWQTVKQPVALTVAWVHGCVGLYLWLRFRPWFERAAPWLLAAAVAVPTASLAGYVAAGMEIRELARDPAWLSAAVTAMNLPASPEIAATVRLMDWARIGFAAAVAAAFVARSVRLAVEHRSRDATLRYGSGKSVRAMAGMTVLSVSQHYGIPHASVCGGRGRCSTCRIRIGAGLDDLARPSEAEARVLSRIAAPPNVRLACQTVVVDGLEVMPLLPPHTAGVGHARGGPDYLQGRELDIAVLFADLRGFTQLSEHRLPYDVVFILNRYFAEMGAAIEGAGGRIDKFIGDGIMALFGIESGPAEGARQALAAARAMGERLADLNASLEGDLNAPLRIGIGIHLGSAIVGEMGYGRVRGVTAVGDTVNTASRLEALTKEHGAQLIVSQSLVEAAGVDLGEAPTIELDIRGRSGTLAVRVVEDATALAAP
ncbi:adenylate/guanylate cyclase domain-containing protein [Thalassobaculum sp.]|uniref:adenylate/guanylate cyclase domain-containing protein n=1 Tax=Thalassobaculum sp. TaxID=2022740 RepID=UPI0032ED5B6D